MPSQLQLRTSHEEARQSEAAQRPTTAETV
jgi:hypothetical protein